MPCDGAIQLGLEINPQSKLNHARVVDRLVDNTERGRAVDILHVHSVAGQTELSVIEEVEEFSAELQSVSLVNVEILECRKIRVHKTRTGNWRAGRVSEFSGRGNAQGLNQD